MRSLTPIPVAEAKASVIAWAIARGIPAREDRGWIILEMSDGDPDPVLKAMADVLKGSS